jgi:CRISPR-associated endonuclease/helicase Cas3
VSTQLVEAGVDFDFPVLYRAFGGFDSIAQAAGRCNREGRLERGEVWVFKAPTAPPKGTPQKSANEAATMLALDPSLDPIDPEIYDHYFRRVYDTHQIDPDGIQAMRVEWKFRSVAEAFSMIEDDGSEPIVVPYGDASNRLAALEAAGPGTARRRALRAVQPFVVTVYPYQFRVLERMGVLRQVAGLVWAVDDARLYSDRLGLLLDNLLLATSPTSTG